MGLDDSARNGYNGDMKTADPVHEPGYDWLCPDCRSTATNCGKSGQELPSNYVIVLFVRPDEGSRIRPRWEKSSTSRRFSTADQARQYGRTINPSFHPFVVSTDLADDTLDALNRYESDREER